VGQEAFGPTGRWLATLGALLATCSAINATLFSTARQMRDMAAADELPVRLELERNGLPVTALTFLAAVGAAFAMLPGILEVLAFGSATFLVVFALVNLLSARAARRRRDLAMGYVGALACSGAIVALGVELYRHDRPALVLVFGCLLGLALLRVLFVHSRRRPSELEG
jgi:amino acid transporter